jgi:hypothetical protein
VVATLTPPFEALLRETLGAYDPRHLAAQILCLSDFYHANPGAPTPWSESFTMSAYTAYFLPLNYARLRSAWIEVERAQLDVSEIWDFGSGLGTAQWVLEDSAHEAVPFYCQERSPEAASQHRVLHRHRGGRFSPDFQAPRQPGPNALGIFSYSFLEMVDQLPDLKSFAHLLIVEPSTRECGRQLMEWRARLLGQGFHVLAPCTHAAACPLLTQSTRDWCHMRVGFEPPEWWSHLEDHLPMKNRTLTYSYLLVSRMPPSEKTQARVIGDTLEERGKTRQMICRGPRREFLSWLHRYGTPPQIPHGALLEGVEALEPKGAELRVPTPSPLRWSE